MPEGGAGSQHAFAQRGREVSIFEPVAILKPEAIWLQNHIWISEFSFLNGGRGLYVGNYIHIANHASIIGGGHCVLEDFVGVSAGCRIVTGSASLSGGLHNPNVPAEFGASERSKVWIERHALLFTNVIVHPGVTIGEGAVVASGGVVTKDLEPWGVYVGAPARRTKERPREEILRKGDALLAREGISPLGRPEIERLVGWSV
jgi:galactoside O-acetyltransferase